MVHVEVPVGKLAQDPKVNTRKYLYENHITNQAAAKMANQFADQGLQTLILIQEVDQFIYLHPHLKHETRFVFGDNLTKDQKERIPKLYHKPDLLKSVADFNDRKFKVLVGSSSISTGTDIRSVDRIIFLMGGTSEIKVRQAVGRGTRLCEGKNGFEFIDFSVDSLADLKRHAKIRSEYYLDVDDGVEHEDLSSR
jgi:superfamily II DNA or RNA helicase